MFLCTGCYVSVYRMLCFCVQAVMFLCTGRYVSVYSVMFLCTGCYVLFKAVIFLCTGYYVSVTGCYISVYRVLYFCVQSVMILCTGCYVSVYRVLCFYVQAVMFFVQDVMFLCTGCHVALLRVSLTERRLMLVMDIALYFYWYILTHLKERSYLQTDVFRSLYHASFTVTADTVHTILWRKCKDGIAFASTSCMPSGYISFTFLVFEKNIWLFDKC